MSKFNKVHFSSASDCWATPQDLLDKLNAEFGPFGLDVCASKDNSKCGEAYFGLDNGWDGMQSILRRFLPWL